MTYDATVDRQIHAVVEAAKEFAWRHGQNRHDEVDATKKLLEAVSRLRDSYLPRPHPSSPTTAAGP